MKASHKKVVIYTTRFCPYCVAAKKLLTSKNIHFEEIDITHDDEMWDKLVELTGGRQTVPQIFVDEKLIGGYDDLVKFYNSGKSI
jgi:glutaredoxin 3